MSTLVLLLAYVSPMLFLALLMGLLLVFKRGGR